MLKNLCFGSFAGAGTFLSPLNSYAGNGIYEPEWYQMPFVEAILAAIIFISIVAEIKTAGFSGGGLVAVIAGGFLLGANWNGENIVWLEFLLYFGGIALILLDIFLLLSGIGIAIGLIAVIGGLYLTFGADMTALWVLSLAIILVIVGFYFLAEHLPQSRFWEKITLQSSLSSTAGYVSSSKDLKSYEGETGVAITVLRPSGKVRIKEEVLDAASSGEFIKSGTAIKVLRAENNYLVVEKI